MSTIALILITWNRAEIVKRSVRNSLASGLISEVQWVDNGSELRERLEIETCIRALGQERSVPIEANLRAFNRGAAWALNRACEASRADYLLVTDGDIEIPSCGIQDMVDVLDASSLCAAAVSMYPVGPELVPERFWGAPVSFDTPHGRKVELEEGLPMVAVCFRKDLLAIAGYRHEGMGLVHHDDIEWGQRAAHHAKRVGRTCWSIRSMACHHIPEDCPATCESEAYRRLKASETGTASKNALLAAQAVAGWPYYSPFQRTGGP